MLNLIVSVEEDTERKYGTNDRLTRILDIKSSETVILKKSNQKAKKIGTWLVLTEETI